MKALFKQTQIV